jgi:hypothetical protein
MEHATFEAFKGLFIPYRLQMVLAGQEHTYFGSTTDRDAEHTYLHETIHWWQTAMTGYGHSTWSIFRQLTSFAVTEWTKATNSNPHERLFSLRALTSYPGQAPLDLLAVRIACESSLALARARFGPLPGGNTLDKIAPPRFRGRPWRVSKSSAQRF